MKDQKGLFYYPYPQNKSTRMYVKEERGIIFFRLWDTENQEVWEKHGWIPYDAIQQAMSMYTPKSGFNPNRAYDLEIAKALISENF